MADSDVLFVFICQCLVLTATTVGLLIFGSAGHSGARAFCCGGLIQIISSGVLAGQVFIRSSSSAECVASAFYRGELMKYVLTGAGFALSFIAFGPASAPLVFAGFGLMLSCQILLLAFVSR